MELNDLKNVDNVKKITLDIAKDVQKEMDKIKDVNKENFINGFNDCFLNFLKNEYFEFSGRVCRRRFWMITLYSMILGMFISVVTTILPFLGFLGYLYMIVLAIPSICLYIRRLHDINLPGWFVLLMFIPFVGFLALVFLFAIPGDNKANNYGPKVK